MFKRMKNAFADLVAAKVAERLSAQHSWRKFLPPVVVEDRVYLVTEDGTVFVMYRDEMTKMEQIVRVHR